MHAQKGRSDKSMFPKLPKITKNSWAKEQRAVHDILIECNSESVTPSQLQRFSTTPTGNREHEHICGLFTDMIPLRTARKRMHSVARNCRKNWISIHSTVLPPTWFEKWRCIVLEQPLAGKSVSNPALQSNLGFQKEGIGCFRHRPLTFRRIHQFENQWRCALFSANLNGWPVPRNQKTRTNTNKWPGELAT